ncbi:Hypothetical predicted protein [Cloeon dipterum]|uniref:NACHT domain-containing protein n=1 Tax=Cloeon dipterum TaxID=197152 RepID=A0A8S1DCJ2_9INSE|nr:Hypothetical predicted protein [Cloeon dipterum]
MASTNGIHSSQFGFFNGDQVAGCPESVCVLVVHYNFEHDLENIREGNAVDIERLQLTFESRRNCQFCHLRSPKKETLLSTLSNDDQVLNLFDTTEVPSVLILVILSHGGRDGKIYTDHRVSPKKYEYFTTFQVLESLRSLQQFESSLKLVFFGPCRGEIVDEVHDPESPLQLDNRNSCRVTNHPQKDNFILVFSTVETTRAKRDEENGTALVQALCEILDGLCEDTALEIVLTCVQNKIHENSGGVGQSPEVKFSPHREFTVLKCPGTNEKVERNECFFSWLSSSDLPVRGRWAAVVCDEQNKQVQNLERIFRENLDFETCILHNSAENLESLSRKAWDEEETDIGCIAICYFAKLLVNNASEVCVKVEGKEISIGNLVQKFIGPDNEKWIGRPKLFFFVHQSASCDFITRERRLSISATNHSGWFVLVLPNEDGEEKLAEILQNPLLRRGKSLQEISIGVLRLEKGKQAKSGTRPQIVTTLPHLLDFPIWHRRFVPPNFVVTTRISIDDDESVERVLSFRQLKSLFLRELQSDLNCTWLVSAPPGMGKSTLFCEMEYHLRKELGKKVFFRIQMIDEYEYLDLDDDLSAEGLLQTAKQLFLHSEISNILSERRAVILLDGFDEVCPDFRKKTLALIKEISMRKIPLWIATRPQEEEQILAALKGVQVRKVEIAPFDKPMQLELLKMNSDKKDYDKCSELLEKFESVGAKDILKNPFHLTLIANQAVGDDTNLFAIYRNVVERKVREALTQKESYDENNKLFKSKVKKRIKLLQSFARCFLLENDISDFGDEKINQINNTGIATIRGEKNYRFVHQTLAEFLLAQLFVFELAEKSTSTIPLFEQEALRQSRIFFDAFVAHSENEGVEKFIRGNMSRSFVETIVCEAHCNLFHAAKKFVSFADSQSGKFLIEDGFSILKSACRSSETIGRELLQMNLLEQVVQKRPAEELWTLIQQVARSNFCQLFDDFLATSPDVAKVLQGHKTSYLPLTPVQQGHERMLELLLQNGLSANISKNKKTALQVAIVAGNAACVRLLISHGAKLNPSPRDSWKRDMVLTPLHIAACNDSADVCRCMVEHGADLGAVVALGGWTAFHFSCSHGILANVEYFLSLDFYDVNANTSHGRTPLILAAEGDHAEVVQLLLRQQGVNPFAADKDGWNALHYAARYAGLRTVVLVLSRFKSELIESRTKHGWTPLQLSVQNSDASVRRYLVLEGSDLTAANKDGWTVLHWASHVGDGDFIRLVSKRMDVNLQNKLGRTALHLASEMGHKQVVKLLLKCGADGNIADSFGMLPFNLTSNNNFSVPIAESVERSIYDVSNSDVSVSKYVLSVLTMRGYIQAKDDLSQ